MYQKSAQACLSDYEQWSKKQESAEKGKKQKSDGKDKQQEGKQSEIDIAVSRAPEPSDIVYSAYFKETKSLWKRILHYVVVVCSLFSFSSSFHYNYSRLALSQHWFCRCQIFRHLSKD